MVPTANGTVISTENMIRHQLNKIALIGDYVPRKCGIATFTHDVCRALQKSAMDCLVVAVNDVPEGYPYPPEVRFEITEQDLSSYRRAGDFLNFTNAEIVCLQHEFGIYGGRPADISSLCAAT